MATRREYLASLNPPLAKPNSRGRFSLAAKAELVRAKDAGMKFDDDGGAGSEEPAPHIEQTPYVPPPIISKPKIRDIKRVIGYTEEGYKVASDVCFKCSEHVTRCNCRGGIYPSKIVVRWDAESEEYGQTLDSPVRV